MSDTVRLARDHGVAVGAHPGFDDREHFGRRELAMPPDQITALVTRQIEELASIAADAGLRLQHVKAHGALYNMAVRDRTIADAIARAAASVDPSLILLGLPDSELVHAARAAGLRAAGEAFADRAYRDDGMLVPRSEPGAVIHDEREVLSRVVGLVQRLNVETICVHGDTPGAAQLAARIRGAFERAHYRLVPLGDQGPP